jgi:hypothetical protein
VLQNQHDGQISKKPSSSAVKNISLYRNSDLRYSHRVPSPSEGRFAVVTKRWAWDAMDAVASGASAPDENAAAYDEVVWSWRRDPGVYPARLCGHGNGDNKGRSPGRARSKS